MNEYLGPIVLGGAILLLAGLMWFAAKRKVSPRELERPRKGLLMAQISVLLAFGLTLGVLSVMKIWDGGIFALLIGFVVIRLVFRGIHQRYPQG